MSKLCSWYFCPITLPVLSMAYAISANAGSVLSGAWVKLLWAPLMTLSVLVWVTTACGVGHCNSLHTCLCSYSDDSYTEIRVIAFLMPKSLCVGKARRIDMKERNNSVISNTTPIWGYFVEGEKTQLDRKIIEQYNNWNEEVSKLWIWRYNIIKFVNSMSVIPSTLIK